MTVRQQWAVVLAAIVVLGGGALAFEYFAPDNTPQVAIGAYAPTFTAHTLDSAHQVRHLADYRGHVVLLNVWATWCEPCKAEMPALETLYRQLAPQGLRIVAVSTDLTATDDSVAAYARNMGLTFDVLHDSQDAIEKEYQIVGFPSSYLIDKKGRLRAIWLGARNWTDPAMSTLARQLLGNG